MITLAKLIIGKEEKEMILQVLDSGMLTQGEKVSRLERELADLCQVKHAVVTNSGTSALHTTLYSLGIQPGDEVITTPFTFISTTNAMLMMKAKPVFVDIDQCTFNIDSSKIEKAVNKKTKVIVAVNLYGQPADYLNINRIAKKYDLKVVEDAAQSINAVYKGKKSGSLANIGCFSFYATKNIMCGEGGALMTNNKDYAERAKRFRHHGQNEKIKYEYLDIGCNYRLTDIQAAIALAQLKRLDRITKKRREIAALYNQAFGNVKGLITPFVSPGCAHVYHQYTLRVTKDFKLSRDELKTYLGKRGIASGVYYPKPLYYYSHLRKYAPKGGCRRVEKVCQEVLSLPAHPLLTKLEVDYIINTILEI